jgi:hypothetical protein
LLLLRFDVLFRIARAANTIDVTRGAFTSMIEVLVGEVAIWRRPIHGRTRQRAHGVTTLLYMDMSRFRSGSLARVRRIRTRAITNCSRARGFTIATSHSHRTS